MTDKQVRVLGEVEDIDGTTLAVGVDCGTVALYVGGWLSADGVRLDSAQVEEFGRLFIAAVWEAAKQEGEMTAREVEPAEPVTPDPEEG